MYSSHSRPHCLSLFFVWTPVIYSRTQLPKHKDSIHIVFYDCVYLHSYSTFIFRTLNSNLLLHQTISAVLKFSNWSNKWVNFVRFPLSAHICCTRWICSCVSPPRPVHIDCIDLIHSNGFCTASSTSHRSPSGFWIDNRFLFFVFVEIQ